MSEIHKIKGELREHDDQTAIYRDPNGKTSIFGRALEALDRQEEIAKKKDYRINELNRRVQRLMMLLDASREALESFEDGFEPRTMRYENADNTLSELIDDIKKDTEGFERPIYIVPFNMLQEHLGNFLYDGRMYDLYLEPDGVVARYGGKPEDFVHHRFYTDTITRPEPEFPPFVEALKRAKEIDPQFDTKADHA